MQNKHIYLDYAATTPMDERVLQSMLPYFQNVYGNPSSIHFFGQQAEAAVEDSRQKIADSLHARPEEIFFTSGGTESDNLALRGAALAQREKRNANRLLISPVEHPAVIKSAQQLREKFGFELDILPVDEFGQVNPEDIASSIREDTALVSVVYGNNEIGTINPVAEIGAVCRKAGVLFHTDAVQAAAHLEMNVHRDKIDLLSIGGHKFYGPKGIGVLFIQRGTAIQPVQTGGGQERQLRAGTENVPYMVGLAEALRIVGEERVKRSEYLIPLRDRIISEVLSTIPRTRLTGHPTNRLPNHASFVFENVDGNYLLMILDREGFCCSSGSACKVGNPKPSTVLEALGLSRNWTLGSLRVTLGKDTHLDEVDAFLKILPNAIKTARR